LAAFIQTAVLANYVGLLQRITITIGWIWLTLLAIHLRKMNRQEGKQSPFTNGTAGETPS
jgi:hypothetical protein